MNGNDAPLDRPSRVEITPAHLAIALLPVIWFVGTELALDSFGDPTIDFGEIALSEHADITELTGRYRFLAALTAFVGGAVGLTVVFFFDLMSRQTRRSVLRVLAVMAGMATVVWLVLVWSPRTAADTEAYAFLGAGVFETVLGEGHVDVCGGALQCGEYPSLYLMNWLLDWVTVLTGLGAASAVLGTILALGVPVTRPSDPDRRLEQDLRILKRGQRLSRRYAYGSGILLTLGMTLILAWMVWPQGAIADPAQHDAYSELVGGLSLFLGIKNSVLILTYYLPVMLILEVRAARWRHRRRHATDTEAPPAQILDDLRPLDSIKVLIAVIAPTLTGAIGGFGSVLSIW